MIPKYLAKVWLLNTAGIRVGIWCFRQRENLISLSLPIRIFFFSLTKVSSQSFTLNIKYVLVEAVTSVTTLTGPNLWWH